MEVRKDGVGLMVRLRLRLPARITLVAGGLALVGLAVLLALQTHNDLTSVAALLCGVVMVVAGFAGRLPEEVGLHRVVFGGSDDDAAAVYREALHRALRTALPEAHSARRADDWRPDRPTYWIDELALRIVVSWVPDASWRVDVGGIAPLAERGGPDVRTLLVTNVDEIDNLQEAVRSSMGERGAVVRWRSPQDTDKLRLTVHDLRTPDH
jgi:hypothetical protein